MDYNTIKRMKYSKSPTTFPKFRMGTFLIAIFCSFLIVIATFTPYQLFILTIPGEALVNPGEFFNKLDSFSQISRVLNYIPQIPVVIMISTFLGPYTSLFSILLYIGAGLYGLPIFASGGGPDYFSRLGFGYILGFIPGVYITGKLIRPKPTIFNIIKSAFFGIIAIHIIGIIYLSVILFLKHESIFSIFGWIWQLSGIQSFYDIIFGICGAILGRFLRKLCWIATD